MVFFNYATMQMAAKIVYYGPGLCGKTTNLHYIYSRTSPGSRGEMVSLETETDRTLFFDLLPLDVGVIGGFRTRVQLYTVPGQVFYNTTRKLVLKGVDGIVFVADSQKAMKEANVESLTNLRTNLAEIGLQLEELPLVFQYNKRDLSNILSVQELDASLNPHRAHESYEACAVLGQGVFETLKAISKLTLRSLKKRMLGDERPTARPATAVSPPTTTVAAPAPRPQAQRVLMPEPVAAPAPAPELPKAVDLKDLAPAPPPAASAPAAPPPPPAFEPPQPPPPPALHSAEAFDAADVETVQEFEQALNSLDAPLPEPGEVPQEEVEIGDVSFAEAPAAQEQPAEELKRVRVRSNIDILAELEKLRKNATAAPLVERPAKRAPEGISIDDLLASSLNHRKEINRVFEVEVPHRDLARGHQLTVGLRLEDKDKKPVGEEKSFAIELHARQDIEKLLLSLKFHILGK
jgi:signal recognition particle receptor subunit beta